MRSFITLASHFCFPCSRSKIKSKNGNYLFKNVMILKRMCYLKIIFTCINRANFFRCRQSISILFIIFLTFINRRGVQNIFDASFGHKKWCYLSLREFFLQQVWFSWGMKNIFFCRRTLETNQSSHRSQNNQYFYTTQSLQKLNRITLTSTILYF